MEIQLDHGSTEAELWRAMLLAAVENGHGDPAGTADWAVQEYRKRTASEDEGEQEGCKLCGPMKEYLIDPADPAKGKVLCALWNLESARALLRNKETEQGVKPATGGGL